jgi:drug/metabolite transporter (DMT)-like permease
MAIRAPTNAFRNCGPAVVIGAELAATFGLLSAASWGGGDFSGGLSARRASVLTVGPISRAAGVAVQVCLAMAFGEHSPSHTSLAWAAAAGLSGCVGITALYRSLAVGRMGINSPLTAVLSASFPVFVAAVSQGLPGGLQILGFGLALVGVWYLSRPDVLAGQPQGLGLAVLAGLGFGGFYVLISQIRGPSIFWPLAVATGTSFLVLLVLALVRGRTLLPAGDVLPLALLAGTLDAAGGLFFLLATHFGRLDVSAVLASLYPAVTVFLARLVLRERMTSVQAVGVAAVLMAIPLIAA